MNLNSTNPQQTTSNSQLRSFALIFAGVFAVIAFWPLVFHGESPRIWASVVIIVFVAWGFLHPSSLQKPYRAWMIFGGFLGRINSKIILSIVFFLLVTPIRMIMSIFGYDPMNRRLDREVETYKVKRQPRPASHMSRQF